MLKAYLSMLVDWVVCPSMALYRGLRFWIDATATIHSITGTNGSRSFGRRRNASTLSKVDRWSVWNWSTAPRWHGAVPTEGFGQPWPASIQANNRTNTNLTHRRFGTSNYSTADWRSVESVGSALGAFEDGQSRPICSSNSPTSDGIGFECCWIQYTSKSGGLTGREVSMWGVWIRIKPFGRWMPGKANPTRPALDLAYGPLVAYDA